MYVICRWETTNNDAKWIALDSTPWAALNRRFRSVFVCFVFLIYFQLQIYRVQDAVTSRFQTRVILLHAYTQPIVVHLSVHVEKCYFLFAFIWNESKQTICVRFFLSCVNTISGILARKIDGLSASLSVQPPNECLNFWPFRHSFTLCAPNISSLRTTFMIIKVFKTWFNFVIAG